MTISAYCAGTGTEQSEVQQYSQKWEEFFSTNTTKNNSALRSVYRCTRGVLALNLNQGINKILERCKIRADILIMENLNNGK